MTSENTQHARAKPTFFKCCLWVFNNGTWFVPLFYFIIYTHCCYNNWAFLI